MYAMNTGDRGEMMSASEFVIDSIKKSGYKDRFEYGVYIAHIKYKYHFENEFINSYEVFSYSPMGITWLDDWDEGQDVIVVLGVLNIEELSPYIFYNLGGLTDAK